MQMRARRDLRHHAARSISECRVALSVLLIGCCLGGCGETPQPPSEVDAPERVVVIVIDATHAAHLGCYGGPQGLTPHIDALADRGVRFERAFSNNTWTLPSTASLLTGLLQERHGVITNKHRLAADLPVLPEQFREAGWQTAAFVQMIYASAVFGLDRGFDEYHYYSSRAGVHPLSMDEQALSWMEQHRGERYLLYIHLRRPHSPYDKNFPVQQRLTPDCPLLDGRRDGLLAHADSKVQEALPPEDAAHVEHLYRGNLATVDSSLGKLLDELAADEGALVLLTSDHGEAMGQHGHYGHGHHLDAECVDIPLIVAGPGIGSGVDGQPACTIDVLPTLLELCGLTPPAGLPGRSLVRRLRSGGIEAGPADPGERAPILLSSAYRKKRIALQGVVLGNLKLVLDRKGGAQLFDRRSDPGDTTDVSAEHPEDFARMLELAASRREFGASLPLSGEQEFNVNEEELRALGYVR